MTVIYRNMKVM